MGRWEYKYSCCRRPRTMQERRANQDRNNPYVRGKRRNLPNDWDDIMIKMPKSWKKLRNIQYRENKDGFEWRTFFYDWRVPLERMMANRIKNSLDKMGICYELTTALYGSVGVLMKWFGPEIYRSSD